MHRHLFIVIQIVEFCKVEEMNVKCWRLVSVSLSLNVSLKYKVQDLNKDPLQASHGNAKTGRNCIIDLLIKYA